MIAVVQMCHGDFCLYRFLVLIFGYSLLPVSCAARAVCCYFRVLPAPCVARTLCHYSVCCQRRVLLFHVPGGTIL
jgi:hypothetical protein